MQTEVKNKRYGRNSSKASQFTILEWVFFLPSFHSFTFSHFIFTTNTANTRINGTAVHFKGIDKNIRAVDKGKQILINHRTELCTLIL
jgi:hypothetical protein